MVILITSIPVGSAYIIHVRVSLMVRSLRTKMVNKQDFENYTADFQITIGNKIAEAINTLNEAITVKLENNKDEIIQSLQNEVSSL